MKSTPLLLALFALALAARAEVKLPALFSDHMVLQAGAAVPVWGWAGADEEVTVSFAVQTKKTKAGADGKWMVKLDRLDPSAEARVLTAAGVNTLTVKDVLTGEVWLGSGQSNMALNVGAVNNAEAEIAAATWPQIRMFKVNSSSAATPQEDCAGTWQVCSPATVRLYSAAAYFFGRELHRTLGVPVGLINSSVGGTPIESWISLEAQQKSPALKASAEAQIREEQAFDPAAAHAAYEKKVAALDKETPAGREALSHLRDPVAMRKVRGAGGGLFNGKIAPLIPYALRGVIWYQGEANSAPVKAPLYRYQLPALIADWRARWGDDFPFAWVQLPNFEGGPARDWPQVREAMLQTLAVKNTGMAIAIDIGDPGNIHPKNKQEAGRRLAQWALGEVYARKVPSSSGPLPGGHEVRGGEIVLRFRHVDGGLSAKGGELKEFTIAGEDRKWVKAEAKIEGETVIVSSPEVPKPVAVRYAWTNKPEATLFNRAGLPASPFRTDDWK
jgi:sialate O-acetylesterase